MCIRECCQLRACSRLVMPPHKRITTCPGSTVPSEAALDIIICEGLLYIRLSSLEEVPVARIEITGLRVRRSFKAWKSHEPSLMQVNCCQMTMTNNGVRCLCLGKMTKRLNVRWQSRAQERMVQVEREKVVTTVQVGVYIVHCQG